MHDTTMFRIIAVTAGNHIVKLHTLYLPMFSEKKIQMNQRKENDAGRGERGGGRKGKKESRNNTSMTTLHSNSLEGVL